MKKLISLLLVAVLVMCLGACGAAEQKESVGLQVGYGRQNITPSESVPLNGYGNNEQRKSENILDLLYVTCIAFREGEETVLLITHDLLNTEPNMVPQAFDLISQITGVDKDRIMLCSTHTHSAPDVTLTKMPEIANYMDMYWKALVSAAEESIADLQPAKLYGAAAELTDMTFVRHYLMNDGTYYGSNFGSTQSGFKEYATEKDANLRIVKADREGDNKDIMIMNWQAHPCFTGGVEETNVSADYIGVVRSKVEADTGMHFAFFQGAAGNQITDSRMKEFANNLDCTQYGEKLAQSAIDLLPNMTEITGEGIASVRYDMDAAVNHDDSELITQAMEVNALYTEGKSRDICNARAQELGLTSQYHANAIVARQYRPERDMLRLDAVRIGGMAFVAVPYEMFSNHSLYIKENSPFEMTIISTSSNDDAVYIPTIEAYEYGCYESYVSYYAKGTGEAAADKLIEMLKELKG